MQRRIQLLPRGPHELQQLLPAAVAAVAVAVVIKRAAAAAAVAATGSAERRAALQQLPAHGHGVVRAATARRGGLKGGPTRPRPCRLLAAAAGRGSQPGGRASQRLGAAALMQGLRSGATTQATAAATASRPKPPREGRRPPATLDSAPHTRHAGSNQRAHI